MTNPVTRKMAVSCLIWSFETLCDARLLCPECHDLIRPDDDIQFDHRHAIVHGGSHKYQNLRAIHKDCHKKKTARDNKANAKIKRILGETCTGPKRKVSNGPGFPPKGSRPMRSRRRNT